MRALIECFKMTGPQLSPFYETVDSRRKGTGGLFLGQPVDDSRLSYYTITQLLGRKTATLARKNDNFFRFFHMEIHDAEKNTKNGYAIIIR